MLKMVLLWLYSYHWLLFLLNIGLPYFNLFYYTKILSIIVESLFYISGVSSEHRNDSKVNMIVDREIDLLLELYRYSSD